MQERTARTEVQNEVRSLMQKLPVYKWLVALPQLTSRICHPAADVKTLTQEILKTVATTFPQQARAHTLLGALQQAVWLVQSRERTAS